jgi:hypothetical protein
MTSLMKIRFIPVACVLTLLTGCTWLMRSDFDNAREVAAIDIGKAQSVTKTMNLSAGDDVSISFVVRGYDCKRPLDGTMGIVIRGAKGVIKEADVDLGKLTWPRSGNSMECFPIGYWALDDVNVTQPLKFGVDSEVGPITIDLNIKRPASLGRPMSVWVVYNSRLPVERMLK